jgi:hypothetical protein
LKVELLFELIFCTFVKKTPMVIDKAVVIKSIQELPDSLSFDQLMERLLLLFKIEEGLKDLREGKFVSLEEAKLRHEKWLK